MTDNRWGWVTAPEPEPVAPQPVAVTDVDFAVDDVAHAKKQHINSDAGFAALDLWSPADQPNHPVAEPGHRDDRSGTDHYELAHAPVAEAQPAGAAVEPVRGGADAPTEQFPALGYSQGVEPPVADLGQAWAESPVPAGDGLDHLVTTGRARRIMVGVGELTASAERSPKPETRAGSTSGTVTRRSTVVGRAPRVAATAS